MRMAVAVKSIAYRYAIRRSQVRAFFHHLAQGLFDLWKSGREYSPAGIENDVPARWILEAVQAECFADPSFDPVTVNGITDGARNSKPDAYDWLVFTLQAKRRK